MTTTNMPAARLAVVAIAAYLAVNVADLLTTFAVLGLGGYEGNHLGVGGAMLMKVASVSLFGIALFITRSDRVAFRVVSLVVGIGAVIMCAVVLSNLTQLVIQAAIDFH